MTDDVLFTITKEQLETGLRGYPVGYCTTSTVDPIKGLSYVEKPVPEMAFHEPEKVIYLLYTGKEATQEEIESFKNELRARSACTDALIQAICKLPKSGHPMKLFSAALLLCGMLEGQNDYKKDCLDVIAKIPIIAATVINHHAGWNGCRPSNPSLGYIENFVNMLNVPNANDQELIAVMKVFNILHFDHGGGNLSAFVGKAVASGLEDMYGSLASAMCALAGSRHGKANQDSLQMVKLIEKSIGKDVNEQQLSTFIEKRLENKDLIYGYGHAVLRAEDPRATIFFKIANEKYPNHSLVKIASLLRSVAPKVLTNKGVANPNANVDAISGILLSAAGFPQEEYYTILFGMARVVGISIQIVYERLQAREGKGTPIVRPKYFYKSR